MYFKLNYKQYSDLINIENGVFRPLKNFVNQREFEDILNSKYLKNNFFPYPIFLGINKTQFNKIKDKKEITLSYKSYLKIKIEKIKFFTINKDLFGKKIYGKNFKKHPYFKIFKKDNFRFLSFKIIENKQLIKLPKLFLSPSKFKKKIKKKVKVLPSFHTRNVPHTAHQWIHKYLLKKYKSILIHPLIGQYKKGEYKNHYIIKTNIVAAKLLKSKKVFCLPFFSYPRYGGPREAALHALVRKNYGCSHFWVGRDHAGYKNFFSKYDSQKFCKKNEGKLGIKIISKKEPYFCNTCKKITNNCQKKICKKNKISISGTKIRNLILKKKKIPEIFMNKKISKFLNKKSLL